MTYTIADFRVENCHSDTFEFRFYPANRIMSYGYGWTMEHSLPGK